MLFCAHAAVSWDVIRLSFTSCATPTICALAIKDNMALPPTSTGPRLRPLPIIQLALLFSAIAIAYTDRLLNMTESGAHRRHRPHEGV
jgi:hypothetical protein